MKNLFFIITLLSSVYSFGQRIPKFSRKSPNIRPELPVRLIPIYYATQMSSDNDDRQQRFQNSFNS